MAKLNSEAITKIFLDCLFKDEEIERAKKNDGSFDCACRPVEMICGKTVVFNWPKLLEHKAELVDYFNEVDDVFKEQIGGGYSFLNLCVDKDGKLWGEQKTCDEFVTLGIGLGICDYLIDDRSLWCTFPGGVPYIIVYETPKEIDRDTLPMLQSMLC